MIVLLVVTAVVVACGDSADETTTTEASAPDAALAVAADVVWGPLNIPADQAATQICVLGNRFPRNSEIVWRARVTDPVTGDPITDETGAVEVQLSDGQVLEMRYGPHPPDTPTDFFWTTSFDIPEDYPTGTLGYEIVASSNEGQSGTFTQFQVAPSLLTITDEVLETIEEG
jgi:hypothetical protein